VPVWKYSASTPPEPISATTTPSIVGTIPR
jgi:hypothetical protein